MDSSTLKKKKNHLGPSRWITHLNHKLSFSGLSKHSGASEAEETLLRSRNQLLIFPKEIKDSQEHGGTCCKSQHLQGWRWSWFHPESPGARLPAQETQVLCQTTERILGNSCTCRPHTSLQNHLSLPIQTCIFSPQRRLPKKGLLATRNTIESCESPKEKESSCHWLLLIARQYRFQPGGGSRGSYWCKCPGTGSRK